MLFKSLSSFFITLMAVVSYGHELSFPLPTDATREDINLYHFCRMSSANSSDFNPLNCVASVKAFSGQELVSQCFDQFVNIKAEPKTFMHSQKSGAGESLWHRNYEKKESKSVSHRYDYTQSLRDLAGTMLGRRFYDALKRSAGVNPLRQSDLDHAFAKGYVIGYLQPDFADFKPDLYCEKGKPTCESSSGEVKNQYPNSNPPAVRPPENAVREDGALIKSKKDLGPAEAQDQNPIEACIMANVAQKLKTEKAIKFAPWGVDIEPEQRKNTNRYLLKIGICDTTYWGSDYCSSYNKKVHDFARGASKKGA